jgi:hypothetical protein
MLMVHTHVEFDVNAAVTNDPVILNEKRVNTCSSIVSSQVISLG